MIKAVRGREARPAPVLRNVAKTLAQTAVFWTIFLFLIPTALVVVEGAVAPPGWGFRSSALTWLGGPLFVAGGALGLTSGMVMAVRGRGTPLPADCPRELVVAGPYRYVRNPMAIAGLSQGVAVGLVLGSPAVVAYALLGGPAWDLLVRPWEEADLDRRFGEPYRRYRAAVRCWIPRFPGHSPLPDARPAPLGRAAPARYHGGSLAPISGPTGGPADGGEGAER